jgi:hypothetical protein
MPGGDEGDRIGRGPWHNAKGVMVAKSVDDLHCENVNITKDTALAEKGEMVSGRADSVNMRDKTWHGLARAVRRGLAISKDPT